MPTDQIQSLCELGQERLERMEYLAAEAALAEAEQMAWQQQDWDAISRLYMPLQETRRQRRQRCGEGIVQLDLLAANPSDSISVDYEQGQFLLGGWGTLEPAIQLRKHAAQNNLYVETFLAMLLVEGDEQEPRSFISPSPGTPGEGRARGPERLIAVYPLNDSETPGFVLRLDEIPKGPRAGSPETYAVVMSWWERLHTPFLAAADAQTDPIARMAGYRRTIEVDYACELAHQRFSNVARQLCIR